MRICMIWDEFKKADWRDLASTMTTPLLIDLRNLFSLREAGSLGIKYVSLGPEAVAGSELETDSLGIKYVAFGRGPIAVSR